MTTPGMTRRRRVFTRDARNLRRRPRGPRRTRRWHTGGEGGEGEEERITSEGRRAERMTWRRRCSPRGEGDAERVFSSEEVRGFGETRKPATRTHAGSDTERRGESPVFVDYSYNAYAHASCRPSRARETPSPGRISRFHRVPRDDASHLGRVVRRRLLLLLRVVLRRRHRGLAVDGLLAVRGLLAVHLHGLRRGGGRVRPRQAAGVLKRDEHVTPVARATADEGKDETGDEACDWTAVGFL